MSEGSEKPEEKQILRTGIVIAGAYADRVRRVLYAQLSQMIKAKRIDSREAARAAGELNQILYEAFVKNLALSKGDLVRIEIPYTVSGGRISWDYSALRVRAFREIGDEVVEKAVEEAIKGRQPQEAVSRQPKPKQLQ